MKKTIRLILFIAALFICTIGAIIIVLTRKAFETFTTEQDKIYGI